MNKLIISDTHYHNFDRFATTDEDGVNSRLKEIIAATVEAVEDAKAAGIKTLIHGGDCFHVRGKISPTVLNPVIELYSWIVKQGFDVYMIAGNHDLESRESNSLTNTASALRAVGVNVINETTVIKEIKCVFVPWHSSLSALKQQLLDTASTIDVSEYTAVIHAPMNGVLTNIPDNGLDAKDLDKLGYMRIYCGHYHNHKVMGSVVSIGALTHQNFGDLHSRAGFILEREDDIHHIVTSAPQFVDVDMVEDVFDRDEFKLTVQGNYVRARLEDADERDVAALRADLTDCEAAGILITSTAKRGETTVRATTTTSKGVSVESSISAWVAQRDFTSHGGEIEKRAIALLGEI